MSPVRVGPSRPLGLGQAEVGHPGDAPGVHQDVRRLDVAVEDALAVGVGQRLGHLDAQAGDAPVVMGLGRRRRQLGVVARRSGRLRGGTARRDRTGPIGLRAASPRGRTSGRSPANTLGRWCGRYGGEAERQGLGQPARVGLRPVAAGPGLDVAAAPQLVDDDVEALPADELHRVVVDPLVLADAEDRHDVRVVQLRRRPRLAAGTAPGPARRGRPRAAASARRGGRATPAPPRRPRPCPPGRSRGGCGSRRAVGAAPRARASGRPAAPVSPSSEPPASRAMSAGKRSRICPASPG